MTSTPVLFWIVFHIIILGMLAIDLLWAHKKPHAIALKEALLWSVTWFALGGLFAGLIAIWRTPFDSLVFLSAYFLEKSLSLDNLFVFLIIFNYFKTPPKHMHRILFWGVIGAIAMRALFLIAGIALLSSFRFIFYVFGFLLLYAAFKMFKNESVEFKPGGNFLNRLLLRFVPLDEQDTSGKFFHMRKGYLMITPLALVLISIETSDLIFALDSIPAVLGITEDFFLAYTSNIFAILGLRSLFFALRDLASRFYYLHYALAMLLGFIGLKMILSDFFHPPIWVTLVFIPLCIGGAILASIYYPPKKKDLP